MTLFLDEAEQIRWLYTCYKLVAHASHGGDPARVGWIVLQFLPQVADVDIHRAVGTDRAAVAPYRFDQRLAAQRPVWIAGHVTQ